MILSLELLIIMKSVLRKGTLTETLKVTVVIPLFIFNIIFTLSLLPNIVKRTKDRRTYNSEYDRKEVLTIL